MIPPHILTTYAIITLGGWLLLPLVRRVLPHLADQGAGVARIVAVLLTSYLSWLLAYAGAGQMSFSVAAGIIALVGVLAWWRWAGDTLAWILAHWRMLLVLELAGIISYIALLIFRGYTADITTLEKYTNTGIVSSILLQPEVPPRFMWFGGQPLNYYYLGQWTLALLCRVCGVPPTELVIVFTPMLAAICLQSSITLVSTLLPGRSLRWSLLAGFFVLVSGSFTETFYGLANWSAEWQRNFYQSHIPLPIADALKPHGNQFEVPVHALLWGEMHSHVLGIPLLLLLLVLLSNYAGTPPQEDDSVRFMSMGMLPHAPTEQDCTPRIAQPLAWYALCVLATGVSYGVNSWQYPTMLVLVVLVLWWRWLRHRQGSILTPLIGSVAIVPLSLLVILPFLLTFEPFTTATVAGSPLQPLPMPLGTVFVWCPVATSLPQLFLSMGLTLVLAGGASLALVRGTGWYWLLIAGMIGAVSGLYRPIGIVLVPLIAVGIWLCVTDTPQIGFTGLLLALAALIVLGCDYVIIPDYNLSRSNTLFKFYLQAWIVLAYAGIILLATAWARTQVMPWRRRAYAVGLVVLVVSGSIFPVLRGRQWLRYHGDRWWGLQGMAQVETYHPDEAAAIAWLQQQPDSGGVLEAVGSLKHGRDERLYPARISALTGRPTPLGWLSHVSLWYNYQSNPHTQQVFEDINNLMFPESTDVNDLAVLMRLYTIKYIVYGTLERSRWGSDVHHLLQRHTPLLWQSGDVQIYGQPTRLPAYLTWLPASEWSSKEYTTDNQQQPFHWLTKQHGRLNIWSQTRALVHVSFDVLESVEQGSVTLWYDVHHLVNIPVRPHQQQSRTLWLLVDAGQTTIDVQTDIQPHDDDGHNRYLTLAVAQPRIRCVAHCEGE